MTTTPQEPIVSPSELDVFLGLGGSINVDRAAQMIDLAQSKCARRVSPVPDAAADIVLAIAGRGYTNITQATTQTAGPFQAGYTPPAGGLYVSRSEDRELRLLAGGGGAFSIELLPEHYHPHLPPWDENRFAEATE